MTIERKIPSPWFRASSHSTQMCLLEPRNNFKRIAPLVEGERELGNFVLPPFQRPPVWTEAQQIRLIESCWSGLPIGSIVYNRANSFDSPCDMWLIDGQQRVTALYAYMNDAFPVYGYKFSELTEVDKRFWWIGTPLPSLETHSDDPDELRDIYDRLAYGGTPHEVK